MAEIMSRLPTVQARLRNLVATSPFTVRRTFQRGLYTTTEGELMKLRKRLAYVIAISVLIGGGVVGVVAGTATPAYALDCYDGWLKSSANGKYVSVEMTYTGVDKYMLRARASAVGPYEQFEFCWGVGGNDANLAIRSIRNGKWVSAELGYGGGRYGMLRARADSIGPWESFNGALGLRNNKNWKYVTAELGYGGTLKGMLRARGSAYGPWEKFTNCCP